MHMARVKVYLFRKKHDVVRDESIVSERYATLEAIVRSGGDPIMNTALEVDESQLDAEGFPPTSALAESLLVQRGSGVLLGQYPLERRVVALDACHRIVHQLSDRRLLGLCLQVRPPGFRWDPKDVPRAILIGVFGIRN